VHPKLKWIVAILVLASLPLAAQTIPVAERTLPNGMRFLFVEKHNVPTVATGWVARVGAANERPGITGLSHMLEHMMKKGTRIIGTKDPVRDAQLMAEQDRVQAEIRGEMSLLREKQRRGEIEDMNDPKARTPRLQQLLDEFNKLLAEQRTIMVKEELPKIYAQEGGAGRNAFTSTDMTAYVVTVPSNKLELWCWLESDRLQNLVLREFYSERDVILEERRQGLEATPTGLIDEQFEAMLWTAHPYHWGVIGWKSDIGQVTREQAEEYFKTFYAPHNLTAVLVGDIKPDEAWPLIEHYFSRIPPSDRAVPEMITMEPPQKGEQRMIAEADTTPSVEIHYKTVPQVHKDYPALQAFAGLLNGRSGRLYKALVADQKVATSAASSASSLKYAGEFIFFGNPTPERRPEDLETALYQQIDKLQKEPVTDRELQKVKNQVEVQSWAALENNFGLMVQLMMNEAAGSYKDLIEMPARLRAVTREDVQRVAQKYFTKENRSVLILNRKAATVDDPELAKLPPEEMKPAVAYLIKVLRGRIQKLEDKR
jgi:predicted Zn-dependent peptidase